jgi:hypothetical protein
MSEKQQNERAPRCTKCSDGDGEWDFGEVNLCQDCWEAYCDATFWESRQGLFTTPIADAKFGFTAPTKETK